MAALSAVRRVVRPRQQRAQGAQLVLAEAGQEHAAHVLDVVARRAGEALGPGRRQLGVGAPAILERSGPGHQPLAFETLDDPGQPAAGEQARRGEVLDAGATLIAPPQAQQHLELGVGHLAVPHEVLGDPPHQPALQRQEPAPRSALELGEQLGVARSLRPRPFPPPLGRNVCAHTLTLPPLAASPGIRRAGGARGKSLPPALSSNYDPWDTGARTVLAELGGRMEQRAATLGIQVAVGPDADAEEVAASTEQLRRELLDLDVEEVQRPAAGQPPPGAKGVELAALGALVVTVAQSQLLTPVVAAVRSWLAGQQQRSIKLELDGDVLELTGLSTGEQRRLTEEWLSRHTHK